MLNASEIGQFRYCSVSWFLQRCGFKPESKSLELGEKKHFMLGETIDRVEESKNKISQLRTVAYILLFLGFLFFFFEVVL